MIFGVKMGYFSYPHALWLTTTIKGHSLISGFAVLCLMLSSMALADESPDVEQDCGKSEIRYVDDPSLTRAERLMRMEQAFFDSVNRFEACELSQQSSASDGNAGGDSGAGTDGGAGAATATASQEMQGTEAETFPDSSSDQASPENETEIPPGHNTSTASADNGAIPEDIPAANNDDAIAAQIRLAAENETDPEIREKLWNEYRKYKGMKVVE